MEKLPYQELFLFAAKAGALEGYLFQRSEVGPLDNWIDNLSRLYYDLTPEVKTEVDPVYTTVLKRILDYGEKVLEAGQRGKLEQMLVAAAGAKQSDS